MLLKLSVRNKFRRKKFRSKILLTSHSRLGCGSTPVSRWLLVLCQFALQERCSILCHYGLHNDIIPKVIALQDDRSAHNIRFPNNEPIEEKEQFLPCIGNSFRQVYYLFNMYGCRHGTCKNLQGLGKLLLLNIRWFAANIIQLFCLATLRVTYWVN